MKYDISVVIPFYKRDDYAKQIYNVISDQSKKENISTELIFVDSKSRSSLEKDLNNSFSENLNYKIFDTRDYVSVKRNFGISKANSENVIIMDDDCLPCENFLKNHYYSLTRLNHEKILICGMVKYKPDLINKSNYFKFRDEGHRKFDENYISSKSLNLHNIVVMNMSFKKNILIDNSLEFNEEFNTYGFEDLQFSIDALCSGFKIMTNQATVIHQDSTPLKLYHKKLQSFAKTYFFLFYPYNLDRIASKNKENSNEIIMEHMKEYKILSYLGKLGMRAPKKNIILIVLFKLIGLFFNFLSFLIMNFLYNTDRYRSLYSFQIYKLFVRITIIGSFFEKKQVNKEWL